MRTSSCVFCDFENIKDGLFYEDGLFYGVYNKKPVFPGHVMLIPKRHRSMLFEMTEEEKQQTIPVLEKFAKTLLELYNKTSYEIVLQDGPHSGQSIQHVHFHLFPQDEEDSKRNWFEFFRAHENAPTISLEEQRAEADKIRKALGAG